MSTPADPSEPYRVMTVCTGNICRSPMAEVVLRDRLERAALAERVVVDSTGTSGEEEGGPMDRRARAALVAAGYDPGRHTARRVAAAQVGERDLVLAMTAQHARALRALAPEAADRVVMLRAFDPQAPSPAGGAGGEAVLDVEDPWYGGQDGFEEVLALVEAAADGVVDRVRADLDARGAGPR